MSQGDNGVDDANMDTTLANESAEPNMDVLAGILADGLVGALGGFVGSSLMTVVLLVGASVGGFEMSSFGTTAELIGLDAILGPDMVLAAGYIIFLGGGMTTWPLLFASIGRYLPGDDYATAGLAYGFVLWTGFVLAFNVGYSGVSLALYVLVTFIAHLVYGFAMGSVFDYLGDRPDTLV
ncbi:MAG: DUF6789 family protein [Haloglomus sp.]